MKCVWCKSESVSPAVEHIIPDCLGCPPELLLTQGEVCSSCNHGLAHLDRALADDFDFARWWFRVPRKDGKSSQVDSRGNVIAYSKGSEGVVHFNMENYAVPAASGRRLGRYGASSRNIKPTMTKLADGTTEVSFDVPFGASPKFLRALYKIGLECLAHQLGVAVALDPSFDGIRAYVKAGTGEREAITHSSGASEWTTGAKVVAVGGKHWCHIILGPAVFRIDLSPDMSLMSGMLSDTYADVGRHYQVIPAATE